VTPPIFRTGVQLPSSPFTGMPRFRRGVRSVTETCLDKHKIDAENIATAANNIVAFSRQAVAV